MKKGFCAHTACISTRGMMIPLHTKKPCVATMKAQILQVMTTCLCHFENEPIFKLVIK